MTDTQWNRAMEVTVHFASFYKIPVTDKTILSHAEVQKNLGIAEDAFSNERIEKLARRVRANRLSICRLVIR